MSENLPIAERVEAIVAALEHPTSDAIKALARKAREAAVSGAPHDRAEWGDIADELDRRSGAEA